jgi:hypothetical protein
MERACTRARGDERLSGKQKVDSRQVANRHVADGKPTEKKSRKQRSTDIGRALRSVYDDTVREDVPDDFMDLLGKLS